MSNPFPPAHDRLLRRKAVEQISGLKRTQIYFHMARGDFPCALKVTRAGRAVAWLESEVLTWLEQRIATRKGGDGCER